jgi:hypothetical protein
MSLAKVVGQDFSRAFLNQVELGRAQPSTRVLRVIAGRLGTQVDYLLEGRLPGLDREISLERARVLLLKGRARRALATLEDVVSAEWPLGTDARLCRAEALASLGRQEEVQAVLAAEKKVIVSHRDTHRLERWRALSRGEVFRFGAGDLNAAVDAHLRIADRSIRTGDSREALEHYRAARVLLDVRGPRPPSRRREE